ncbi:13982_t:CDS:2, partial [Gigaspora margarita]
MPNRDTLVLPPSPILEQIHQWTNSEYLAKLTASSSFEITKKATNNRHAVFETATRNEHAHNLCGIPH